MQKKNTKNSVNLKVPKNKTRQKKYISNSNTNPKQNKNNNNTNRKNEHANKKWGWKDWYIRATWDSKDLRDVICQYPKKRLLEENKVRKGK